MHYNTERYGTMVLVQVQRTMMNDCSPGISYLNEIPLEQLYDNHFEESISKDHVIERAELYQVPDYLNQNTNTVNGNVINVRNSSFDSTFSKGGHRGILIKR
jgi:hypothetical protein